MIVIFIGRGKVEKGGIVKWRTLVERGVVKGRAVLENVGVIEGGAVVERGVVSWGEVVKGGIIRWGLRNGLLGQEGFRAWPWGVRVREGVKGKVLRLWSRGGDRRLLEVGRRGRRKLSGVGSLGRRERIEGLALWPLVVWV